MHQLKKKSPLAAQLRPAFAGGVAMDHARVNRLLLGIPERNTECNVIYCGRTSPPQTDALSLVIRRVSVCFPSSKIRCAGSGVFDGHHGPMARAAGAVPGANVRTYCDPWYGSVLYMLSTGYPKIFNSLCLVKKLSLDSRVCCLCFPNDYQVSRIL